MTNITHRTNQILILMLQYQFYTFEFWRHQSSSLGSAWLKSIRGSAFFFRGGVNKDVWKFSRGGSRFPSVFQTSQPSFPDSKRLFPIFRDENSQPSFLTVFSRLLGLEGGGQRPLNVFFAKIGAKVPEIFFCVFNTLLSMVP